MNELDERYSVADEAIFDAFVILVKEKGIDKVTVADVTKKFVLKSQCLPSVFKVWFEKD